MATSGIGQGTFNYKIGRYPVVPSNTTQINLAREFESYQKKADQWTYVEAMLFTFTINFKGSNVIPIAGVNMPQVLRQLFFTNSPHDIRLAGEFMQYFPYLNDTVYPFADPTDLPAGTADGASVTFTIMLPFYDRHQDDPYQLVDPVQRFIETNQMLSLQIAQANWFDPVALMQPTSSVLLELVLNKRAVQYQAPSYVWRFEDRNENPFLLNIMGVQHHVYGMLEAQPQHTEDETVFPPFIPAHTALTNATIEPFELTQPLEEKFAFIRQWELIMKNTLSPNDVISIRTLDSVQGVDIVIPYIIRGEANTCQHSQMPTMAGQQKYTLEPSSIQKERCYMRYVRPADQAQVSELRQNFRDPDGVVSRFNPAGRPASDAVAATARLKLGAAPRTSKGTNSASKPVT